VCGWMFFVPRKQLAASFEMGDDDRLVRGSGYFFCVRDIPSYAYEIALRGNLTALLWPCYQTIQISCKTLLAY